MPFSAWQRPRLRAAICLCVVPADSHCSVKQNQSSSAPHADSRCGRGITALTIWVIERKLRRNSEVFLAVPVDTICTIHKNYAIHCLRGCNILHIFHDNPQPSTAVIGSASENKHLLNYSHYSLRYSHCSGLWLVLFAYLHVGWEHRKNWWAEWKKKHFFIIR